MKLQGATMKRYAGLLIFMVIVVATLGAAHAMMTPLPIAAATTALGGVLAILFWRRHSRRGVTIGAGIGAMVGAAIHICSHLIEGRLHPEQGLVGHITGDVAIGVLIGIVALALPIAASQLGRQSAPRTPQHH